MQTIKYSGVLSTKKPMRQNAVEIVIIYADKYHKKHINHTNQIQCAQWAQDGQENAIRGKNTNGEVRGSWT